MRHRDKHPSYVEDCYSCKLLTVSIGADALPTRFKGGNISRTHRELDQDLEEYREARKDGLQPERSTAEAARRARKEAGDFEVATA